LDADDTIVWYLYKNNKLIKGEEIKAENCTALKAKSDEMFRFLSGKSEEIDQLIRNLPGYIGSRDVKD
jgi:antibiotic biosynthesis monooxygenase (ABM) superfamily enzyme